MLPGPPSSSPSGTQLVNASYNPQSYGPMPGAQASPKGKIRTQGPDGGVHMDTSRWGVKFNHGRSESQNIETKPPLPVCS